MKSGRYSRQQLVISGKENGWQRRITHKAGEANGSMYNRNSFLCIRLPHALGQVGTEHEQLLDKGQKSGHESI